MSKKATYRIRNWRAYNDALVKRGSLTFWFDEQAIAQWYNHEKTGRRGRQRTYSDVSIECALTLRAVFRLPLRATEGLVISLLELMDVALTVPDYSTLCRRQGHLEVDLGQPPTGRALHVVVDATGLKVFGQGEWQARQHGRRQRRTWRKLHVGVDEATGQLVAAVTTTHNVGDSEVIPDLLEQIDGPIEQVSGDGAYDSWDVHRELEHGGIRAAIPPRRGARIAQHGNCNDPPLARDEALRTIRQKGRRAWKREVNYHRRSLAETAIFRLKTLFGDKLTGRLFDHQATEAFLRCQALNRITALGMPESYLATA